MLRVRRVFLSLMIAMNPLSVVYLLMSDANFTGLLFLTVTADHLQAGHNVLEYTSHCLPQLMYWVALIISS